MEIIRHSKNRFEVTGEIFSDVIRGRKEKYSRVFANGRAAKIDADKWKRINAINERDHIEIMATRRNIVATYLAKRAERSINNQLSMF